MLAPLRDYLCPKDPTSSPLLCITKECYFSRLSVDVDPDTSSFEEAKWIISEDVNVEHLLDVFTSTDADSDDVWDTCVYFMKHLFWHKPRLIMLGPKFEGLPDNQPSKPKCLYQLSKLFCSVGNPAKYKQLLGLTLELWRGQGGQFHVAETLVQLSTANTGLGLYKEGIQQVGEALEIFKQLGHTIGQAESLLQLAWLLHDDDQFGAAEEAVSKSLNLLSDKGEQFRVCKCYDLLGVICCSKGETEKAINHFETALGIAASFNWHSRQFCILYSLAQLSHQEGKFNDAQAYTECAKSHTSNDTYLLGCVMELQAEFWYNKGRLEEAKAEALGAAGIYEELGAVKNVEDCRKLLQKIERK
jgi:tetratricopeptide (TPR) repeat protein